MKNKGFTLVEVMAAIIVTVIISSIAIIAVNKQLEEAKYDMYLEQIDLFERKTKEWVLLNGKKADEDFYVTLQELLDAKLIDDKNTIKPTNKENLLTKGACIFVSYIEESKTYTYSYSESCVK